LRSSLLTEPARRQLTGLHLLLCDEHLPRSFTRPLQRAEGRTPTNRLHTSLRICRHPACGHGSRLVLSRERSHSVAVAGFRRDAATSAMVLAAADARIHASEQSPAHARNATTASPAGAAGAWVAFGAPEYPERHRREREATAAATIWEPACHPTSQSDRCR
jgi:hypothetical protein